MPNRDGKGPDGKGATGKGLGPCGSADSARNKAGNGNPRKGLGRGNAANPKVNESPARKAPAQKEKS